MKKHDFAQKLARRSHVEPARAADAIDTIVNDLIRRLRKGESAIWPGFGTFSRTEDDKIQFSESPKK